MAEWIRTRHGVVEIIREKREGKNKMKEEKEKIKGKRKEK
jgi:hypothetical protein